MIKIACSMCRIDVIDIEDKSILPEIGLPSGWSKYSFRMALDGLGLHEFSHTLCASHTKAMAIFLRNGHED